MKQTLKDTVMEIREIVFGGHNIDIEKYAEELSKRSSLTFDDIKNMFNNISMMYIESKNPKLTFNKKKVWESFEDNLVLEYVDLACKEGSTKASALTDLCDILVNRTESSIPFRYYNMIDKRDKSDNTKKEIKYVPDDNNPKKINYEITKSSDDLLDIVVDIVDNVETADVDVNSLFKGILELSRKAVTSSNVEKIEVLEGQVSFLKTELDKEKDKNNSLQNDMAKLIEEFEGLKKEIEYFNGLDGKQKLQQLHNFNKKMKYMIDKFGGVIAVGL